MVVTPGSKGRGSTAPPYSPTMTNQRRVPPALLAALLLLASCASLPVTQTSFLADYANLEPAARAGPS